MESWVSEGYSSTELAGQEKHPNYQADGNPTLENVIEQDKENTSLGFCSHVLKQCVQANVVRLYKYNFSQRGQWEENINAITNYYPLLS